MSEPTNKKKSYPTYKSQVFLGHVVLNQEKKEVKLNSPTLYRHFLNTMCHIGDEVAMYVTSKRPKRSLVQDNYYFLYLSLITASTGHTKEELHIWAKGKFLTKGITEVYGEKTRIVASTSDLNRSEFCEFLCRIEDRTEIPLPKTDAFLLPLSDAEYAELKGYQLESYKRMTAKGIFIKK